MAWITALALLVVAMLAVEGMGAERRFSRSRDEAEPRGWDAALIDAMLRHRPR
jgi:hypothetical protein